MDNSIAQILDNKLLMNEMQTRATNAQSANSKPDTRYEANEVSQPDKYYDDQAAASSSANAENDDFETVLSERMTQNKTNQPAPDNESQEEDTAPRENINAAILLTPEKVVEAKQKIAAAIANAKLGKNQDSTSKPVIAETIQTDSKLSKTCVTNADKVANADKTVKITTDQVVTEDPKIPKTENEGNLTDLKTKPTTTEPVTDKKQIVVEKPQVDEKPQTDSKLQPDQPQPDKNAAIAATQNDTADKSLTKAEQTQTTQIPETTAKPANNQQADTTSDQAETTEKTPKLTDQLSDEDSIITGDKFTKALQQSGSKAEMSAEDTNTVKVALQTETQSNATITEGPDSVIDRIVTAPTSADDSQQIQDIREVLGADNIAQIRSNPARQATELMRMAAQRNADRITVRLDPPDMGRIEIKFQQTNGVVVGVIEADKVQTRDEIANSVPEIIRALNDSGVAIKKVEVVLTDREQQNTERQDQTQDFTQNSNQNLQDRHGSQQPRQHQHHISTDYKNDITNAEYDSQTVADDAINFYI